LSDPSLVIHVDVCNTVFNIRPDLIAAGNSSCKSGARGWEGITLQHKFLLHFLQLSISCYFALVSIIILLAFVTKSLVSWKYKGNWFYRMFRA